MVVRKRNFRGRVRYRKRARGKKGYVKKIVRRTLAARGLGSQMEIKHQYYDADQINIPASLNFNPLTLVPTTQGTGPTQFVGHKITAKYINLRGMLYNGDTVNSFPIRIMVVCDYQPVANPLVLYSALSTNQFDILRTNDIWSEPKPTPSPSRFKVLYDRTFNVAPRTANNRVSFYKRIHLRNTAISFVDGQVSGNYVVNRDYYFYCVTGDPAQQSFVTYHIDFAFGDQ